ncbi:MAG: ImmA/IrrE family metallo-endopeptidase [Elusimicrobia bacterium]|nr:ImmA/IrrE family metallo-endopeptidase [Elusimicrobiota bacterium]
MATFDRGFKTWAERTATSLRRELGLSPDAPLPHQKLADYLEIQVIEPKGISGMTDELLRQLLETDSAGWSGTTFTLGGKHTVIYNPSHSSGRQSSDITHEFSHIIIGHEPSKLILSADGEMVMRSHDQKQEDEASWLAGCILLPREALLHVARAGQLDSACQKYSVSKELLQFRLRVTGVHYQIGRSK